MLFLHNSGATDETRRDDDVTSGGVPSATTSTQHSKRQVTWRERFATAFHMDSFNSENSHVSYNRSVNLSVSLLWFHSSNPSAHSAMHSFINRLLHSYIHSINRSYPYLFISSLISTLFIPSFIILFSPFFDLACHHPFIIHMSVFLLPIPSYLPSLIPLFLSV